ncbi:7-cyano-7-deazaguanine synthase [Thermopirellula anaerolimosa]
MTDDSAEWEIDSPVAVLMSGGLDSMILLGLFARRATGVCQPGWIQPIYIRCGLHWEAEELATVHNVTASFEPIVAPPVVLELTVRDLCPDHWSLTGKDVPDTASPDEAVYLPGRNLFMLAKAGIWCQLHGFERMAIGVLDTNPFGDAAGDFFDAMEVCLAAYGSKKVRILRPLCGLSKKEWMRRARDLPLDKTFSCIAPRHGLHCGLCNKCAERRRAFREAGLSDRTIYESDQHPAAKSAE